MPVVASQLAADLEAIFVGMPSEPAIAANLMAQAYDTYCKPAFAPPGLPVFTGTEKQKLELLLFKALADPAGGTGAKLAKAWADGIQLYWLTPVPFSGGPASGVVTAMPGAAPIIPPLTGVFSNAGNSAMSCAQQVAQNLDAATKTVLVTYATPPPPTGPPPPSTVI